MTAEIGADSRLTIWQLTDIVVDHIPNLSGDRRSARTAVRNRFRDQLAKGKVTAAELKQAGAKGPFPVGAFCDWVRKAYKVPLNGLPQPTIRRHAMSASGDEVQSGFARSSSASSLEACQKRLREVELYAARLEAQLQAVQPELEAYRKILAIREKKSESAKRAHRRSTARTFDQ